MAAKTFEEWIHDGLENEHIPTDSHGWLRRAWNAATIAAEERFTSHNSAMDAISLLNEVLFKLRDIGWCPDLYSRIETFVAQQHQ